MYGPVRIERPDCSNQTISTLKELAKRDLADRVEAFKISPQFLNNEEMSKLWMATQSHYRPSMVYLVSLVVSETQENPQPIT